jgi:hypothetical protein
MIKRMLGYASLGAAKVAAKRAWKSESYVESTISAAEAGMWAESAKNLLYRGLVNNKGPKKDGLESDGKI